MSAGHEVLGKMLLAAAVFAAGSWLAPSLFAQTITKPTAASSAQKPLARAKQVRSPLPAEKEKAVSTLGRLPISFEENRGQADAKAKFLARGRGHTLVLKKDEASLVLRKKKPTASGSSKEEGANGAELRMKFSGANPEPNIHGEELLPGKIYYADANTIGPLTGNPTFRRVKYSGIYPGIDTVYYGNDHELEFDFLVAPHADPKQIHVSFSGADKVRLTATGEVVLLVAGEEVRLKKPAIYQERDGARTEILGGYTLTGRHHREVRFALGAYDASLPLIIDPAIDFATYIGSDLMDSVVALETDASGSIYLFGAYPSTASIRPFSLFANFPLFYPVLAATPNCFLAKMTPNGNGGVDLDYAAVLTDSTSCDAMTLSATGEVFTARRDVSGQTWIESFSFSTGVLSRTRIYLLDQMGQTVQIRADASGNVYAMGLCGQEQSPGDFWPLPGGAQPDPLPGLCRNPNAIGGLQSQYLLLVSNSAGGLTYGTFVTGSAEQSEASALEIDAGGKTKAYVAGRTNAGLLAVTPNALQSQPADVGPGDAFLVVIDPAATGPASLFYSSYLGGSSGESNIAMVLDDHGAVYLSGNTDSPDFPHQPNPSLNVPAIFLVKLDISQPPASQLVYSLPIVESPATTVMHSRMRFLPGLTGNPNPRIALFANTSDTAFPLVQPVFTALVNPIAQPPLLPFKPVLLVFDPATKSTDFATFLSDSQLVTDQFLAFGSSETAIIATVTTESTPSTDGSVPKGQSDIRLFSISGLPAANTPPTIQVPADFAVQATSALGAFVSFSVSAFDAEDGANLSPVCSRAPGTLFPIGVNTVTCSVTDSGGLTASASFNVTVTPPPPNTPIGTSVTVSPVDETPSAYVSRYQPVTLTFAKVTAAGTTRLQTRYDLTPPPPDGLQTGSPASYFDLSTAAVYDQTAGIDGCFDIRGMALANPAAISLYQLQNGAWVSLPSTLTSGVQICTHVAALGSFAIFYPQVPQTKIATIAGTGFARDAQHAANDGGPATNAALSPVSAVLDRTRKGLYVSDLSVFPDPAGMGSYLRKIDLNTGIITGVLGVQEITYSLTLDSAGDLYFSTPCQVRKLTLATGLVSIVAGTGVCGFSGDGQLATQAQISPLNGQIVFDGADNLFIADSQNARIRRVAAATGIISTVAGDGTVGPPVSGSRPTLTGFGGATGIAIDSLGSLLIVNTLELMRVSPGANNVVDGGTDEVLTVIGGCSSNCQPIPFGGDGGPVSQPVVFNGDFLSVASDGAVLVSEQRTPRIRRIDPGADHVVTGASDEIVWTVAGFHYPITNRTGTFNGDTFSTQSTLAAPGLALEDLNGNLLIIDDNNNRIRLTGYSPLLPGGSPANADLSIKATATPDPVDTGNLLTYGPIVVSNAGPLTATGVSLNFVLPQSATFQSVTTSQGTCTSPAVDSTGTVNCSLGTLAQGATATVTVGAKPQTAGPLAATISVLGNEADFNSSNNIANVTTTVNLGPATISVTETIHITDTPAVLPSAMIPVSETIKVTDTPGVLPSAMIPVNETIKVTDAPGLLPSAMIPVNENIIVTDLPGVTTPSNTPVGTPTVIPPDQNGNPSNVTITFAGGVTAAGFTSVIVGPAGPALPPDFVPIANPLLFYDVRTTAQFNPPVVVCIALNPVPRRAALLHFNATTQQWEDLTIRPVPANGPICAQVSSLSPFALTIPANNPPTANAGSNQTLEATGPAGAAVTLSGSGSDPDAGDTLSFAWSEGATSLASTAVITVTLPIGVHSLTLTVTDNHGASATASVFVTVQDTKPPLLVLPGNQTLEATSPAGTAVTFAPTANDVVDGLRPVICSPASGSTFPLGLATESCTSTDTHGNTAAGSFTITVRDTTPPNIVITTPASGAVYVLNQAAAANYTCTDKVSSVATCVGPVSSGANLDTATAGTKTFTVNSRDAAGNTSSRSVTYQVLCHYVTITASPSTVAQGGTVTISGRLMSCASTTQTVVVQFTLTGPSPRGACGTVNSVMFTTPPITLPPNTVRTISFPFRVPSGTCPGTYSITATTKVNGNTMDVSLGTLTVTSH